MMMGKTDWSVSVNLCVDMLHFITWQVKLTHYIAL